MMQSHQVSWSCGYINQSGRLILSKSTNQQLQASPGGSIYMYNHTRSLPSLRSSVLSMALCLLFSHLSPSKALCPLFSPLSPSTIFCTLYGPMSPLWSSGPLWPLLSLQRSVPSSTLNPLYDPLFPQQPSVLSTALCLLFSPFPLYGPLSPLRPSVLSTALYPLCCPLSHLQLFSPLWLPKYSAIIAK